MLRFLLPLALLAGGLTTLTIPAAPMEPVVVLVTDPMAAANSCPCVPGYAQRDYDKLGIHLAKAIGRDVKVYYAESVAGLKKQTRTPPAIIIGKDSVVRHQTAEAGLKATPLAALTGRDGKTTQSGLIVVFEKDPALIVGDLTGYTIYLGPEEAIEKHQAAIALLTDFKIALPEKKDTCISCTVAATRVLDEAKNGKKVAGLISNYAQALLEGCGTIKKGELRVVGETEPVPFVVAFATDAAGAELRDKVQQALMTVAGDAPLCKILESKAGFVALPEPAKKK